ncbi:MAG: ATP-binding protein [Bifidobacteriaceae bacterium]|jgi:predicted AAA+ superfamily ATPase|nr:ATP-binding protein [Bifidobacteriaceae bacterium]
MERAAMSKLTAWREAGPRRPLLVRGARQVGKTWLLKEFGKRHYARTVYVDFDADPAARRLFASGLPLDRVIAGLALAAGGPIDPADTLLVLDEIQECPEALAALKYFQETAPEYQVVCAGSLLGVALHAGTSFPVGKVDFLDLYPMTFAEFLQGLGREDWASALAAGEFDILAAYHAELADLLRRYYYVGGMPEAVAAAAETEDPRAARAVQQRVIGAYQQDFSKHVPPKQVPRLRLIYDSLPDQLARENKKFQYSAMKPGSRAKDYELALQWLTDAGLVLPLYRATAPRLPLTAYTDRRAFKLFASDVGLLGAMVGLEPAVLVDGNAAFTEFKGALTEQYVRQELAATSPRPVRYWTNSSGGAEVDFLVDTGSDVVPIEVKAERNLRAKSLRVYRDKYRPARALRASMMPFLGHDDGLAELPLYAIGTLQTILNS